MIYVLIFTAVIYGNSYKPTSIVHTEHDYPTMQACQSAYTVDKSQIAMMDENTVFTGTCLKVK
jgi:hypothetical protein